MDTSHTPAPWQVFYMPASSDKEDEHHFGLIADKCEGTLAENYSNACLMAAAPELLEALIDLLDRNPQINHGVLFARAAIAKALGA